jgi:hypothetical protein
VTVKGSLIPIDTYTLDMRPRMINRKGSTVAVFARDPTKYDTGGSGGFSLKSAAEREKGDDAKGEDATAPSQKQGKVGGWGRLKTAVSGSVKRTRTFGRMVTSRFNTKVVEVEDPWLNEEMVGVKKEQPELTSEYRVRAVQALQKGVPSRFVETFNKATASYLAGEWAQAKQLLDEVAVIDPGDNPMRVLLEVMGATGFKPPADWKGFRALDKK